MIIEMASSLHGQDFLNFAHTSRRIYFIVMSNQPFFIPEAIDKVGAIVTMTPLERIPSLIPQWDKNPGQAISFLRQFLPQYEYVYLETPDAKAFKILRQQFKRYVKVLSLLIGLGDTQARSLGSSLYENVESAVNEEFSDKNPGLYRFHYRNFSFLDPEVRESLAHNYGEGIEPFEKSPKKAKKYSNSLNLPLFQGDM